MRGTSAPSPDSRVPYLIVLSPFGRLSHYVVPGQPRTLCGIPCEDWQMVRNTRGNDVPKASCLRCRRCRPVSFPLLR